MKTKQYLTTFLTLFVMAGLQAQIVPNLDFKWPESNPDTKWYTLQGYRHGPSFFPKVKHPHVQYEPTETLTFDKYHSANVVYHWMHKWAEKYPDLVDIYVVGHSWEGRPIWQITVTNKKTGKATDKPAAFFEGSRHSGEVSATEATLWMAQFLIEQYGKNPEVTAVVNKNAIYLRPINNPDGHNLYMNTAQSNRSTVRPMDNDGDGLLDEDPPTDLNGDGLITQMRWKVTEGGDYIIDPRDPLGRVMLRVPVGEGTHRVSTEGFDRDGDGRIGEDGIGGLDLHRNYPENWRPMREATGRGWTQGGAGEYPLSEPETRAVVTFLLDNPHVYVVNSMDTSVPMHLRAPSTAPQSAMFPEDNHFYKMFDELGKRITGYARAGDVYNDYGGGNPLFGHGPDFGYWYYGAIWYGDEIWNGGRVTEDLNGDGVIDELDRLIWDERNNDGKGFQMWKPYKYHPEYGEVEIGGWDAKFFSQNAPSKLMEPWARNQAMFNFAMVQHLPELEWGDIEVKRVKSYRTDSTDYQIKVNYKNIGTLPTALKQADLVKIVRPDQVRFVLDRPATEAKILPEPGVTERPQRAGVGTGPVRQTNETTRNAGYAQGKSTNSVTFTVRVYGNREINGKATVSTTRAGLLPEKSFTIK